MVDDDISDAEAFGSGIRMNRHAEGEESGLIDWDWSTNSRGSLSTRSGLDKLREDLAFSVAAEGFTVRGQGITPEARADLELDIRELVEPDDRVREIVTLRVLSPDDAPADTLAAEMEFVADSGQRHDLIFPLSS